MRPVKAIASRVRMIRPGLVRTWRTSTRRRVRNWVATDGVKSRRDDGVAAELNRRRRDLLLALLPLREPPQPALRGRALGHREAPQREAEEEEAEDDCPDAIEQHQPRRSTSRLFISDWVQ